MKWIVYFGITATIIVASICRFLIGTLWGVLATSVALYVIFDRFTALEVFTLGQLLLWFAELSESAQVAVAAGLLAAVGLVAAYWTAIAAWRDQRRKELSLAAADEIQRRWQRAQRNANELMALLSVVVEAVDRARASSDPREQAIELWYSNTQAKRFEELREQLHESRREMNDLFGDYGTILMSHWGMFDKLRAVVQLLNHAWEAGRFRLPTPNSTSFVANYLSAYEEVKSRETLRAVEDAASAGAATIGFICGQLRQSVLATTISGAWLMVRHPSIFVSAMDRVRRLKPPSMS